MHFGVSPEGRAAIDAVLEALATDPEAPTSVRDRGVAEKVHVADSLSGLEVAQLAEASRIADVGAGAGFPGLVLAAARPDGSVELIESIGRKCDFMRRVIAAAGLANATVVCDRAETWAGGEGGGRYDAVTVRAVGTIATLLELAAPLLRVDGVLVCWKGRRDEDEERRADQAARELAMALVEVRWVGPYAGSQNRHLHVYRKTGPTPRGVPRRPGMAKKRPFGGEGNLGSVANQKTYTGGSSASRPGPPG
jgi:16S rRNA (guanine527-N7)-methyltransferase